MVLGKRHRQGMRRFFLFILLMSIACIICAQNDTLLQSRTTDQVLISLKAERRYLNFHQFNLKDRTNELALDIGAFLDAKGLAQINRNGAPGAASGIRFRGLSSSQSTLMWNGFAINSLSLGMCDLSLVPAFLFDHLYIASEPRNTQFIANNLAAGLNLTNDVVDTSSFIYLHSSVNSMGNTMTGLDVKIVNKKRKTQQAQNQKFSNGIFSLRTKIFYQWYENRFEYTDIYRIDKPRITQSHNDGINKGFTQDINWYWNSNQLSARLWHQQKQVLLPETMGSYNTSDAEQEDQFTRINLGLLLRHTARKMGPTSFNYFFNNEKLMWRDELQNDGDWLISNDVESISHVVAAHQQVQLSEHLQMNLEANTNYFEVHNSNYSNGVQQIFSAQTGLMLRWHNSRNAIEASVKKEYRDIKTKPSFSFFYSINIVQRPAQQLRFDIAANRKFRTPTMNDLYWQPGGNPNLLAEEGWNGNSSLQWKRESKRFKILLKTNFFYNNIINWIQWQPAGNNTSTPVNLKHVKTNGAEFELQSTLKNIHFNPTFTHRTALTNAFATNRDGWNEQDIFTFIYTPHLILFSEIRATEKWFSIGASQKFTDYRYTDEANSIKKALPPYLIYNVFVNSKIKLRKHLLRVGASVDNLLNTQYESVRSYAMPGRVFNVHLQLEINFNKSNNNQQ